MTINLGLVLRKRTRKPQRCLSEVFVLVFHIVRHDAISVLSADIIAYAEFDCKMHWMEKINDVCLSNLGN